MSTPRARHRFAAAAGFVVAVLLLLWAMAAVSDWITRGRLADDARQGLATLRDGQPLWQWTLRRPADLVAGRAFGPVDLASDPAGLRLTSRNGSAFELGLPLAEPADLAHWPLLRLRLHSDAAGQLGLSYQAGEFSQACLALGAARIDPGTEEQVVDLHGLSWRSATGGICRPPTVVSYMLRLRLQLPARATVVVGQAALLARQPPDLPRSISADTADVRLPLPAGAGHGGSDAAVAAGDPLVAPLVRLPRDASPEAMLALRDLARQRWPAALVLPAGQALSPTLPGSMPSWLDWATCGAYLAWLAWLTWRQTRERTRPAVEVAAIAAGPLWLIAGLRWGPQVSVPGVIAFVAALVFGGVSEWRRRPVAWTWLGERWPDWLWPLLPLPVAAALMLADGHGLIRLDPRHVLAYFGWALLQQWAMLGIVMGRLRQTHLPGPVLILVTAGLFGLLHTPNGSLMQLCLLAELWWAWCFLRSPRLLPVAIAHATCALLVESGLTGHLLRSLEVSARFFL
ncbi:CPBP family intramembrane glutamic endopeptidase [Dyella soli]|uniref:CPBP family intramembrane metalloprotease n=1 Tax=Dyella soli TaxID=522319 RepID=A0A4R0YWV8_9GAMM|nr:CPBP family intramembrane glutamic endopeptidase [Dyella soli]TCI09974.1 CPBP family intramembrane metalloprotease [Dyella soli]